MRSAPIENKQTLNERISDNRQTIHSRQGTSERVRQSTIRHVSACIHSGGGHFAHFLRILSWYTIRTKQLL